MPEDTRAGLLMSFITRTVQTLDAIRTARRALFGKEIDASKKKNKEENAPPPKDDER